MIGWRRYQRNTRDAARLESFTTILGRNGDDAHVPAQYGADEGERRGNDERLYGMKPDVGHIRTFGCVVRDTPPSETLGKLEDRGAMVEHAYEGGYRVWIPRIGVRGSRDIIFFEGSAPLLLDHGSVTEIQCGGVQVVQPQIVQTANRPTGKPYWSPTHGAPWALRCMTHFPPFPHPKKKCSCRKRHLDLQHHRLSTPRLHRKMYKTSATTTTRSIVHQRLRRRTIPVRPNPPRRRSRNPQILYHPM
jgi:hypothetical protein